MGRILYDEITDLELKSSNMTPEEIIKKRWGNDDVIYATHHDDARDCLVCWYHCAKFEGTIASQRTARELAENNIKMPDRIFTRG